MRFPTLFRRFSPFGWALLTIVAAETIGTANAQQGGEAEPAALQATYEQLLAIARQHRPEFAAARRAVEAAQGRAVQAGLYPNPVLSYQGEEIGAGGEAGQQGGALSQVFVTAGKLTLAQLVALVDVELARIELRRLDWMIGRQVGLALTDYAEAINEVHLLEALVELAERQVNVVQELLGQGMATRIDLVQAEIERDRVKAQLAAARIRLTQSRHRLAATVGVPLEELSLPARIELGGPPVRDPGTLWRQLVLESPELARAETLRERAEAMLALQRALVYPDVEVGAGMAHDYDANDTLVNVSVAVALPIFNRNQGNIAAARAVLAAAEQLIKATETGLRSAFAQEWASFRGAAAQAERYRSEIVPAAEENLRMMREAYQQGQVDFLALLVAQRTLFDTRLQLLRFDAAATRSYYRLRTLMSNMVNVSMVEQ